MSAAQRFLRTLPITASVRLLADLCAIALACAPLVIPFTYYWSHLSNSADDRPFAIASTVGCLLLATLTCAAGAHPSRRAALVMGAALAAYVLAPLLPVPGIATVGGSLALGCLAVAFAYWKAPIPARGSLSAIETRLANRSGWALPVLYRNLRYAAVLRVLGIALGVSFARLIAGPSPDCEKMGLLAEVQLAIAVLMLYQLPALTQRRLSESVPFLYRLRRMRVRVAVASRAISLTAFAGAAVVIVAWGANVCGTGLWMSHQTWLALASFGCLLMVLSVMASHLHGITWIAVTANLALCVLLAQIV